VTRLHHSHDLLLVNTSLRQVVLAGKNSSWTSLSCCTGFG